MTKKDDAELDALLAEAARLEAEYNAAKEYLDASGGTRIDRRHPARIRWNNAQRALVEARSAWRAVGEGVAITDPSHPGARPGIKVENNDGSVN